MYVFCFASKEVDIISYDRITKLIYFLELEELELLKHKKDACIRNGLRDVVVF